MMARFAFRDCCKNGDRHLETRSQSPFLQQILTLLSIAIVQAGMAAEPARQVTIRWHGQSFFEVESSKGTHVVFDPHAIEAWEPIPLETYGGLLPSAIRSSWVFILRAGVTTGAERHPNSHQRMMSWNGQGDFQVHDGQRWQSHFMVSDRDAPLENRWISIPPNVWHQGVVSAKDWVVVSFHTVPAADLVEERPDASDPSNIRRRRYVEVP